jgi:hypothetical protein
MKDLQIAPFAFDFNIGKDTDGRINLTDLWKAAGSPLNKALKDWIRLSSTENFIQTACKFLEVEKSHLIKVQKGKGKVQGTFGHKQIAVEYAQYLDPKLAIAVNEIFFQRIEEEKNPQLAIDRGVETYRKMGKDENWIKLRLTGSIPARNEYTKTIASHGAKNPEDYRECTNAIYQPLYAKDAKGIRENKGLAKHANVRDNMSHIELTAVMLSEELAAKSIQDKNIRGVDKLVAESKRISSIFGKAILEAQR